ncbi:serine/threonine protein kinase [Kitasatospora sp. NPDC096147]|uniref:serine/threonine protein kinase n=1 Tax=Kitasatospora sp. NPDC096147 TaxID=3364093 RepID=UPI0037FED5B4
MGLGGLRPGDPRQIGGWTLVGRLGAGGMGVVYLAQGIDGRLVAVKRLREELAEDAAFRARFRREAASLLRVRGTCTAGVLAVETEASTPYVVMEYVSGPTLSEHVGDHGPLRAEMAQGFAAGLAEALLAIHRAGLVHRDLKPANVLFSEHGPKVIDFGIAQAADATVLTRIGESLGTVGYMAPEQLRGQAGPPADVYAWALTVAYACTGRPPFGTGPTEAVLYRVMHGEPDLDGVPAALLPMLTRSLGGSPELRPTPGELLTELTGTAPTGPAPAAAPPGPEAETAALRTVLATAWQLPAPSPAAWPPPASGPLPGSGPLPASGQPPAAWPPPRLIPSPPRRTGRAAAVALAALLVAATSLAVWAALPDGGSGGHPSASGSGTAAGSSPGPSPSPSPTPSPSPSPSRSGGASKSPSATAAPSPSTVASRSATPTGGGAAVLPDQIANIHSDLCIDTNGPQQVGLELVLRDCDFFSGQFWSTERSTLHLVNPPSGLCLDTDGPPAAGALAVLNTCGNYTGQQWRYDAANEWYVNPTSNLCLDTNGPPDVNVALVLNYCGNYTGQHWEPF